ncbi:Bug family tripartite tricarboxylate transporter substrate binding protein [Falsiroseomonas oryziterrae]|uniref:Bug family tripartite tricarboxylate transporter substrate binding protein n=1 Tax=Falsiroseomonas oryziterrae TaxID=2911368 RepID=UPI001F3F0372|nr:tripartite tricarboxylate transporter substrate binding protein [Roseomonas sp. NPKOSM-4]
MPDAIGQERRDETVGGRTAIRRRALGAAAVALAARPSQAQPAARGIRLVVPSVAGSTPDLVCRLLVEGMRRILGPIAIENRPGGFGTVGLAEVARARPDGITLGYVNVVTMAINQTALRRQPFVVDEVFAPVGLLGFVQNVIAVRREMPVSTLPELLDFARRAPAPPGYGSPGLATTGHLAIELLTAMSGAPMLHIPYRGSPQMLEALLRGEVAMACDNISSFAAALRTGDARGLAVTGALRSVHLPEVPTVQETGWPGFRITSWGGLVVPAATPAAAVADLNAAANAALAMPDVAARLAALAFEVTPGTPQAVFDLAQQERPMWADLIRRTGVTFD